MTRAGTVGWNEPTEPQFVWRMEAGAGAGRGAVDESSILIWPRAVAANE